MWECGSACVYGCVDVSVNVSVSAVCVCKREA
jgi:hypothetical protein